MISFLSFCSYVSCASPTSPRPVLGDPVQVRSCQILTHLGSKFSKSESSWSWMNHQRDSLQHFVHMWLNFSMARSLKKKKKGPDPLKAFHLKSPSLTTMQSLGHVNPLPLCSHLLLLLGSHITCCQRSFHLRASARAVSSALNTPSLDTCLVSHFSGFAEMPFSGKLPWPTLPLSKLLSLPFPNSLLLPLLYFSLCLITI